MENKTIFAINFLLNLSNMIRKFGLLFLFSLIFFYTVNAQVQDRPKVGLVLSGGAAHGLAHIGVIKYLEELGIKVDYITGTSMGAVIGGLNSMGMDSYEITDIARNQDWSLLMSNRTPLNEVAPIEKAHHQRIPLSIYWKEDSFKLPQGLIRGQKLDIIISNLYSSAYRIRDFNDLPIPFKCVAVDIEKGTIKVFDEGYLGDAVRASMAIPSVFPPYEVEGDLYVDGGLIRNFPVEECLAMGADYVIGVYVGSIKETRDQLTSMFEILRQSTALGSILDSEKQAQLADLVLYPDVKKMGTFDFDGYDEFIRKGYLAAKSQEEKLKALADVLKNSNENNVPAKRFEATTHLKIDKLTIEEDDEVLHKMIESRMGFSSGSRMSLKSLEQSLSLIYGTKNFSKSSYSFDIEKESTGLRVFTEDIDPYSIGLSLNRFKLYNASLIINAEARNVIGKPSNFRMDIRISENPGMQGEYYVRIPQSPSFLIRLRGKYELYSLPFFNQDQTDRLYTNRDGHVGVEVLREWRNTSLFLLGAQFRYGGLRPKVFNENDFKRYKTNKFEFYLGYEANTLDSQVFPDQGYYLRSKLSYVTKNRLIRDNQGPLVGFLNIPEDEGYVIANVVAKNYWHTEAFLCHEIGVHARWASGMSLMDNFKVGGPIQEKENAFGFLGLDESNILVGNHFALKYGLRLHISEVVFFTPAFQFLYAENLLAYAYDVKKTVSAFSGGIILGINSPIGPLTLDIGYSNFSKEVIMNLGVGYRHIF